jgi:hypothetical protein
MLIFSILKNSISRKFVESSNFQIQLKGLDQDLLRQIQLAILKDPEAGDLIEGTGGVRKMRMAKAGSGKSGGYRVLYLNLAKRGICHLLLIFSKGKMGNISATEKKVIKTLVTRLKAEQK